MKRLIAVTAAVCAMRLTAGICTWTGAAGDGKWSSAGNWSAVPTSADEVDFGPAAGTELTVTLDGVGLTSVKFVKVLSGTVTLKGAEGASLRMVGGGGQNGVSVLKNAELILEVPLDLDSRFDKSGEGVARFRSSLENASSSTSYFLAGHCLFEQGANVHFTGEVGLGLGGRVKMEFRDNAIARFSSTVTSGLNDEKNASVDLIVDGDDVSVTAWNLVLGKNGGTVDPSTVHNLTVKRGAVAVSRVFTIGSTAAAAFVQEGGSFTVQTVNVGDAKTAPGSFSLEGGRFAVTKAANIPDGVAFAFAGGTFATGADMAIERTLPLSGSVAFEPAADTTLTLAKPLELADGAVFSKAGSGKLVVAADLVARGSLSVEAGELCFAAGVTVRNPSGVYTPYPVSIADNATLRLNAVTTRFSLPLNLTIAANGTVTMTELSAGYKCRSILVAHQLTVGGSVQGKGRYNGTNLKGGTGCAIAVPYVWTGAAGDGSWNTAGNWNANKVPPINGNTTVDISAATEPICLSTEAKFGCLISMPGPGETRTVTGDGTVNLRVGDIRKSCAVYVAEGGTLALDVNLADDTTDYKTILGGGTVLVKKAFPTIHTGNVPPFFLDATLAFAGTYKSDDLSLSFMAHCQEGRGVVRIEDGADLKSKLLFVSPAVANEIPIKEIRQVGGTNVSTTISITHYDLADNAADPFAYVLDDGLVSADYVKLGEDLTSAFSKIYPGGDFVMNGGEAKFFDIKTWRNQNYFRFRGGDLYCRTLSQADPAAKAADYAQKNDVGYEFGGVVLHTRTETGTMTVNANATLSGIGGSTIVDSGASTVTFGSAYVLDGVGGLNKRGSGTLSFSGTTKFTGALTVDAGTATFAASSTLDGVSRFAVNDASAKINVNGTVTTSPAVIELAAASCLALAEGKTLSVKRLVVAGTDYADGDYAFGSGTVTVRRDAAGVWIGSNGGLWSAGSNWASGTVPASGASIDFSASALSANASVTLDVPVALSALGYSFLGSDGVLTLSGAGVLTLAADGVIDVAAGDTLVVAAPLRANGDLHKTGGGKLVLSGGVSAESLGRIRVGAGEVVIAGAVNGVVFSSAGGVLTLADGASVSGEVIVPDDGSYGEATEARLGSGKIVASGAFVGAAVGLVLSGETAFGQPAATDGTEIVATLRGAGTLRQDGPGTLTLAADVSCADLSLTGGTLAIKPAAAAAMAGTQTLSVLNPNASSLQLDYTGEAKVLKLVVKGREKRPGLYDADLRSVDENDVDAAKGYLRVLTGNPPGLSIIIR